MNVLQRQMFQRGGPTSPRDIIIAERRKRGLPIRDGIMFTPDLINQVRQLQAGQSIAEIFGEVQQSAPAPDITIQEQPQKAPSEMLDIRPIVKSAIPSVNLRNQIEYYLSQGNNPADILEMVPAATTQMIEEIAQQKGGVINPGVRGPETFEGGPRDVFIDETVLVEGRQPRTKPPIDAISEELIKLEAPKPAPTGEIDLQDPSLVDLETAVVEGQVTGQTNLGPNEYKASDGTIYQIDPAKFEQSLSSESSRILGGILMNPNVEYGSNLASIIENTARARSSTLVPEGSIQVGQPIQGLSAADVIQSGAKFGIDVGKEGIESVFNILRAPFTDPTIAGILGSREREKRLRESGVGGRVNLFETGLDDLNLTNPLSAGQTLLTGGFDEYFKTGGEKPEVLDSIILESSTGTVAQKTDETQKEIEELQKTPAPADTEVVTAEETVTETPEEETVTTETEVTEEEAPAATKEEEITARQARAEDPLLVGNPFTSSEFINFARGLSKGLAQEDTLAAGLATGAAIAAEERAVSDLEKQKLNQEVLLEELKNQNLGIKDRKTILDVQTNMNSSIRDYNNALAAQSLAQSVIDFANGNENIATFGAKIGATMDDLLAAAGVKSFANVEDLSDTKRAQIALTILTNRNIKEILGESGRTISNIDRDIAKKVVGSLDILKLDNIATLKATLDDNIRSIVEKRNEAQRNIISSAQFLLPYDPTLLSRDSEIFKILQTELGTIDNAGNFSSGQGDEFNVDLRGENLLGGS